MDPNQPTPEQAAPRQETGQAAPASAEIKKPEASKDAQEVARDVRPRISVEKPTDGIIKRIISWRPGGREKPTLLDKTAFKKHYPDATQPTATGSGDGGGNSSDAGGSSKGDYWDRIREAAKVTGTKVMETPDGKHVTMDVNGLGLPTDNQPLREPTPAPESTYLKAVQEGGKPTENTRISLDDKGNVVRSDVNAAGISGENQPIKDARYWDAVREASKPAAIATKVGRDGATPVTVNGIGIETTGKLPVAEAPAPAAVDTKADPKAGLTEKPLAQTPIGSLNASMDGVGSAGDNAALAKQMQQENGVKPAFDLNDSDTRTQPDGTLAPAEKVKITTIIPEATAATPPVDAAAENAAPAFDLHDSDTRTQADGSLKPAEKVKVTARRRAAAGSKVNAEVQAAPAEYQPTQQEISDAAYFISINPDKNTGDQDANWRKGEQELRDRHAAQVKADAEKVANEAKATTGPENRPPGRDSDVVRVDSPQGQAIEATLARKAPEMANSFTQNPLAEQTTLQSKDTTVTGAVKEATAGTGATEAAKGDEAKMSAEAQKQIAELGKQVTELSAQVAELSKQLKQQQEADGTPAEREAAKAAMKKFLIEQGKMHEKDLKDASFNKLMIALFSVLMVGKAVVDVSKNVSSQTLKAAVQTT